MQSRLDATQSINGGAKYLWKMLRRVLESVKREDRLWFVLAVYNAGFDHLKDV